MNSSNHYCTILEIKLQSNVKNREFYLESLSHGVHAFSQGTSGWFAVALKAGGQEATAAATLLCQESKT